MKPHTLFAAILFISMAPAGAVDARPPNVVLVVADDLGYADVLFNPQHAREVTTPHLEALARESVICRQGYVSGHVCSPTRAGLMTGRYQQRLGLYTGGEAGSGLPKSELIFPQFLKPAGYATCQLGKWHLGPDPEWSPALRGFDEVFGFLGRGAHDYFKLNDPDDPIYRGTTPVQESGYLTDRLGEEAVSFVTRHKDQPFLLYLAFNAVHAPLQAPADEVAKFDTGNANRNTLLAMGKRMDDAIGNLIATLKTEGLWEETLLFFISDNGGPLAQTAVNTPLRGGKHQDYEGGVRVPFLVCWPGQLVPGESQAVVSSLDILPTCLAAAGIDAPADKPLDGVNLLPILRGKPPQRRAICSGAPGPRKAGGPSGPETGSWWARRDVSDCSTSVRTLRKSGIWLSRCRRRLPISPPCTMHGWPKWRTRPKEVASGMEWRPPRERQSRRRRAKSGRLVQHPRCRPGLSASHLPHFPSNPGRPPVGSGRLTTRRSGVRRNPAKSSREN